MPNLNSIISELEQAGPDKAGRVLARLNSFDSADEITRVILACSEHSGLGSRAAQRILATRLALGEYRDLKQLASVPGIGIKKLVCIIRALVD